MDIKLNCQKFTLVYAPIELVDHWQKFNHEYIDGLYCTFAH